MKALYTRRLKFKGDAFGVFNKIKHAKHVFFLDSSLPGARSQFSYLGFAPVDIIKGHHIAALKKAWRPYRVAARDLVFPAGAVGYLAYDGQLWFGLYDGVIAIDHANGEIVLSALSRPRLNALEAILETQAFPSVVRPLKARLPFSSNFTKASYMRAVKAALKHIKAGDIYQINLSRRIDVLLKNWSQHTDAASIYGQLRAQSPSPFSAYLDDGTQHILSVSPERFLQLRGQQVSVSPMKGTRPRGENKAQDAQIKKELLGNAKEIAELLMVTDLERNDLGRVCEYGSVKVKQMRTIETYATVFQATSMVEGRLHPKFDQFDLLKATFPSGSVTGCPKIAAMDIIRRQEKGPRGLYTGALGYISFTGDMDFNVMIRTLFLSKHVLSFHVGGGIVADSNPAAEYQETCVKAHALEQALKKALK